MAVSFLFQRLFHTVLEKSLFSRSYSVKNILLKLHKRKVLLQSSPDSHSHSDVLKKTYLSADFCSLSSNHSSKRGMVDFVVSTHSYA